MRGTQDGKVGVEKDAGAETARVRGERLGEEGDRGRNRGGRKEEEEGKRRVGEPASRAYWTKYSPGTASNSGLSQHVSPVIS